MFWLNSAIHAVPSAWSRCPPVGSGALRSNTPMLSSPRKPPANTLRPSGSLRLTNQLKFQHQSLEGALQETHVGPAQLRLNSVKKQCRPGVDRRIYVAEVPLVGRDLSVGVGIQVPQHQQKLLFREVEVHQ